MPSLILLSAENVPSGGRDVTIKELIVLCIIIYGGDIIVVCAVFYVNHKRNLIFCHNNNPLLLQETPQHFYQYLRRIKPLKGNFDLTLICDINIYKRILLD